MKINLDLLEKMNACDEAIEWFVNEYGRKSVDQEEVRKALIEYAEETGLSDPLMWIDWGEKRRHHKDVMTYWKTHRLTNEYKFDGPKHDGFGISVDDCNKQIKNHLLEKFSVENVIKSLNPMIVSVEDSKKKLTPYTNQVIRNNKKLLINSTDGSVKEIYMKELNAVAKEIAKTRMEKALSKYTISRKVIDADGEIMWDNVEEKL